MQYKSYKTWSVSGLRHTFISFTTRLIVSEYLKVRVLCANRRWVQESTRDQSNHRQVFGAASSLQPISPRNNQEPLKNQLGNTHLSLTNSDCVAPNMADNFQETSSMCTWNRTKNMSSPPSRRWGEKEKTFKCRQTFFFNSSIIQNIIYSSVTIARNVKY